MADGWSFHKNKDGTFVGKVRTADFVGKVCTESALKVVSVHVKRAVAVAKEYVPVAKETTKWYRRQARDESHGMAKHRHLKATIRGSAKVGKRGQLVAWIKAGGKGAMHAIPVEVGTKKMEADAYLRPARDAVLDGLRHDLEGCVSSYTGVV